MHVIAAIAVCRTNRSAIASRSTRRRTVCISNSCRRPASLTSLPSPSNDSSDTLAVSRPGSRMPMGAMRNLSCDLERDASMRAGGRAAPEAQEAYRRQVYVGGNSTAGQPECGRFARARPGARGDRPIRTAGIEREKQARVRADSSWLRCNRGGPAERLVCIIAHALRRASC
jgi:hypothetical protein